MAEIPLVTLIPLLLINGDFPLQKKEVDAMTEAKDIANNSPE